MLRVDGKVYNFMGIPEYIPVILLPNAAKAPYSCQYTEIAPDKTWMKENFNDSKWMNGAAPFGSKSIGAKTEWKGREIWVRRTFELTNLNIHQLVLELLHDDDVEVYLNGELAFQCAPCYNDSYENKKIAAVVKSKLRQGINTLAMHCTNTAGPGMLDAGLVSIAALKEVTPAIQKSVNLTATQTTYEFTCGGIDLTLNFFSPLLLTNLEILGRPISYISTKTVANDGQTHDVQLFLSAAGEIAANTPQDVMEYSKTPDGGLPLLKVGTRAQPVLQKSGDDLRIDWGYLYFAPMQLNNTVLELASRADAFARFLQLPKPANPISPELLCIESGLGKISTTPVERQFLLSYDERLAIQFFGQPLPPWWR
jgi:hypothetical protein